MQVGDRDWSARLAAVLPGLAQLRHYDAATAGRDALAGLSVAAVALPIGIAYAAIVGLPPEVGLYASILPLLGYALFGSSPQLVVGPDTATCTVVAAALLQLGVTVPADRVVVAAALAMLVGVLCIVAGLLRLGAIASFLSRPILTGYLAGVALALLGGQLGKLTGVAVVHEGLLRAVRDLLGKLGQAHLPTVAIGLGLILLLRLLRWAWPRLPGPLIALALAIALSVGLGLEQHGVAVVGRIDAALPRPSLPLRSGLPPGQLLLEALAILLVSFGSGIVTARSFGARNGYRVDADRELRGFGAANLVSGLFGGFAVTGADSRTAVNDAMGGRTQMVGIVAAAALTLFLVFLTDALAHLPLAALGAVLVSAALDLLDIRELRRLWTVSRAELLFALIAAAGVLLVGVIQGVIIAIAVTFLHLLRKASRPRDALWGRIPGREGLFKLHRHPEAVAIPGLLLYSVEGSVLFFNADHVRRRILWIADRQPAAGGWLVLDAAAVNMLDVTAADMLSEVRDELQRRGMRFGIAALQTLPRQLLERAGLLGRMSQGMIFEQLEDAVQAFLKTRRNAAPAGG
jgi:high affinity sulfate transporter 1